jgi:rhodanese-related sulfurtransferase
MPDSTRISVSELRKRMDSGERFVFIDTRNPQAWAESPVKLPGAIRIPLAAAEQHLSEIPRDQPIVTYCT